MNSLNRLLTALTGAIALLVSPTVSQAEMPAGIKPPPRFSPDRLLVGFHPGTPAADISAAHRAAGVQVIKTLDAIGVQVVAVPANTVLENIALYQKNPNVRFAEPNHYRLLILPTEGQEPAPYNFKYFDEQWGLHNTSQPLVNPDTGTIGGIKGTLDADIDAPEGWDISRGDPTIKIAILDTGVECTHVDLRDKCIESRNFSSSSTPNDLLGHGTHVAGIAAADTNNGVGVAGVGWHSPFGSYKVCYEYPASFPLYGICDVAASAAAIIAAADQGYQVINMSYGSDPDPYAPSQAEADAIQYAWNKGVVLVAAAGNDYSPTKTYPANFPEVIAVAATDRHDNLAFFSQFGNWVSVTAPGHNILSTYPNAGCGLSLDDPEGCYAWLSGTSMAAPHVSGLAALVWAAYPGITNEQVRSIIEDNTDQGALGQNFNAWTQHGRINVYRALTASAPLPSNIALTATGYKVKGEQKADLTWNGATSSHVDVYRDGTVSTTTANDGFYTDNINGKGSGSYTYKICEQGTGTCSNEATVTF